MPRAILIFLLCLVAIAGAGGAYLALHDDGGGERGRAQPR
ncbi:MAG: hypothetical protein QOI73_3529, partial [Solirubrobacteraceae bacterium]|nr:hypothetical protein [Solirubrobacteraceae bacterium]